MSDFDDIEVTDEMVEAACHAFDGPEPPERWTHEEREFRADMRAAIAAALAAWKQR